MAPAFSPFVPTMFASKIVIISNISMYVFIHSTSSFSGRSKYSNFTDESKTYGTITAGGFDIVMWSRDLTLYGVEIKPEFSLAVFRDAIGQVNVRMEERHWQKE